MSRGAALVTGAARRIGRTIALALADAGWDVAVHHRGSSADADDTVAEITAKGRRVVAVAADLASEDDTAGLIARTTDAIGPLTLLVNSASVFEDDRVGALSRKRWDTHMDTNLRAPIVLTEAFAAALPQGFDGCVVNILDQRVRRPNPQFFSYSLSKAALWFATRTMAQALAPRVRVNGVGPGPTLASIHQDDGEFDAEAANILLERRVDPADIAAAVLYLADARSVTGQMIAVDGGQHLAWRTPDIVSD